jgi:hypothetical protein
MDDIDLLLQKYHPVAFDWSSSMSVDLDNDEVFSAAVAGLPRVAELISTAPEQLALAAAQQSYVQTAQQLGYEKNDAQEWASAVMTLLRGHVPDAATR